MYDVRIYQFIIQHFKYNNELDMSSLRTYSEKLNVFAIFGISQV